MRSMLVHWARATWATTSSCRRPVPSASAWTMMASSRQQQTSRHGVAGRYCMNAMDLVSSETGDIELLCCWGQILIRVANASMMSDASSSLAFVSTGQWCAQDVGRHDAICPHLVLTLYPGAAS